MTTTEIKRRGRSRRMADRHSRDVRILEQKPRQIPYFEYGSDELVEKIHAMSLEILKNPGIDFRDDEACALWKAAGADVDGYRIRIDPAHLMALVAKAPSEFILHARDPAKSVRVGGKYSVFAPSNGSPFVIDFEGARRNGTLEDLNTFHKLAYMSPGLNLTGGVTCEPTDIPVPDRPLHVAYGHMRYSDKPFMGATFSKKAAEDCVAMACIAMPEHMAQDRTVMISIINGNSPLVWDETMLDAVKVYARTNQAMLITPFILAGASTPLSLLGAVAQMNAEALAGIAFAQLLNPGCPTVYGQAVFTVSMLTGAPVVGTPEISHMQFLAGQLARRYDLPWRCSGAMCGAKTFDAQAGYESSLALQASVLSGANYIWHSAGWLEGGLSVCYAKFVYECEQCEMFQRYGLYPPIDDLDEVLQSIRDVGPAGHFLGTEHTRRNFESAFFMPKLADSNSFEQWEAEGALDARARALNKARKMLSEYVLPPMDTAINDALLAYVSKNEWQAS